MGIFDLFKKKDKNKDNKIYAEMLNGNTPIFSQFGTNIYASDVVQQAINCIVTEIKKLTGYNNLYITGLQKIAACNIY